MKLFFREIGQGTPLVILHGLFGSCDNWLTTSKIIADAGYRVIMIDQRNHGRSPHSDVFNYDLLANDLKDFLVEHQLNTPILLGHSMGGKTVMQFAVNNPDVASKLVIVDIAPRFYPIHHHSILQGLAAVPLTTLQTRQEADDILAKYEPNIGTRQFLLKNLYRNDTGQFDWRINLKSLTENIHEIGDEIIPKRIVSEPTLFIRGALSSYITDADWADIRRTFTNAQFDTIANADHWVQAEQPKAFVASLLDFISH